MMSSFPKLFPTLFLAIGASGAWVAQAQMANTVPTIPLLHLRDPGRETFPLKPLPFPETPGELPDIFSPEQPERKLVRFPWKKRIVTTVFWVGERPTAGNPVPNTASSWDMNWTRSFGGYDDPNPGNRDGWLPRRFVPRQNPFYIALPYNDVTLLRTKDSAKRVIPWFGESFYREGRTVLKGRWIAIRRGDRVCYGQWEDCGPFETDDWEYVFGDRRPNTRGNGGAGLDVSPAIRDYLGFRWNATCDWRFVDWSEVPDGPWKKWGNNNPFALRSSGKNQTNVSESISKLREMQEKVSQARQDSSAPSRGVEDGLVTP